MLSSHAESLCRLSRPLSSHTAGKGPDLQPTTSPAVLTSLTGEWGRWPPTCCFTLSAEGGEGETSAARAPPLQPPTSPIVPTPNQCESSTGRRPWGAPLSAEGGEASPVPRPGKSLGLLGACPRRRLPTCDWTFRSSGMLLPCCCMWGRGELANPGTDRKRRGARVWAGKSSLACPARDALYYLRTPTLKLTHGCPWETCTNWHACPFMHGTLLSRLDLSLPSPRDPLSCACIC
jgi:hypothetical protein